MGGVEGGKKRWVGTTRAYRREGARKAVMDAGQEREEGSPGGDSVVTDGP